MKKQLQLILLGSMLLPGSTGIVLASDPHCRSWVVQAATQTTATVAAKKRHYSKKVLAAWAVWRAGHPNAKPVRRTPILRPGSYTSSPVPDVLGFLCEVPVNTVDETIASIVQPAEAVPAPEVPDAEWTGPAGPFDVVADATPEPTTPDYGWLPTFSEPTGYSLYPTLSPGGPPSGNPPGGLPPPPVGPPSDNPPTTGSSLPPLPPPPPPPPPPTPATGSSCGRA